MPDLLTVQGLTKRFAPDAAPAVDGVTFAVPEGEIFALLGPSGCGKTTTLRLIAGFTEADAGTVRLSDRLLSEGPRRRVPLEDRGIGIVFQDYALFPHLTVLENVLFGLRRQPRRDRRRLAVEALERVGMAGFAAQPPHALSGGQQQRVAIARTLAAAPRLVLLDEPFSNLDAMLREATRLELRRLLKDTGTTAVLVTHDQEEALSFADRVAVMQAGRIAQVGTPEEIYGRPQTFFVAQFLGRTNLLQAQASGTAAETPLGAVALDRAAEGVIMVSLRPEHLTLMPAEAAHGCPGRVIGRAFKGHDITFRVAVEAGEYLVHTPAHLPYHVGDAVRVHVTAPAVVLQKAALEA